jgi:hypothetical protein
MSEYPTAAAQPAAAKTSSIDFYEKRMEKTLRGED